MSPVFGPTAGLYRAMRATPAQSAAMIAVTNGGAVEVLHQQAPHGRGISLRGFGGPQWQRLMSANRAPETYVDERGKLLQTRNASGDHWPGRSSLVDSRRA